MRATDDKLIFNGFICAAIRNVRKHFACKVKSSEKNKHSRNAPGSRHRRRRHRRAARFVHSR